MTGLIRLPAISPARVSHSTRDRCLDAEQPTKGGNMASRTRIPKAQLTGIYGALVKRMSRKMFGEVPEPVGVMWHNREVLNLTFGVGRKTQKWDQCDEN